MTKMVWPCGWVCQAVRAPGVKWTLAAAKVDVPAGAATGAMYTSPGNPSAGLFWVSMLERVICMVMCSFSVEIKVERRRRPGHDGSPAGPHDQRDGEREERSGRRGGAADTRWGSSVRGASVTEP